MDPKQPNGDQRPPISPSVAWSEVGRMVRLLLALALATVLVVLLFHGLDLL